MAQSAMIASASDGVEPTQADDILIADEGEQLTLGHTRRTTGYPVGQERNAEEEA